MKKPKIKVTLNIYDGDREILRKFYPKLGWTTAMREAIHQFCRKLEERANAEVSHDARTISESVSINVSDNP